MGGNRVDILTRDELRTLVSGSAEPSVSIYMPTHRAGRAIRQDPIRLKNLLEEAEERLVAGGLRAPKAWGLLGPGRKLLDDGMFWHYQSDGLAIFLSAEAFRFYRLPFDFEELIVVADRFHIKPLLPLLSGDGRFYVLTLSQNAFRLLQGTRYNVGEVDLEGVPASLAKALRYDDPEKQLQFHTSTRTPGGAGERPAAFHGHGAGRNDAKQDILRYFHRIDESLQGWLQDEQAPLVLAGVDFLLPIYKKANTYPYLVDGGIGGNPEEMSAEELHEVAWAILHPRFLATQKEATVRYRRLAGAGSERVSSDLKEIVPAAYHGRVETLFVAVGLQQWGSFHPDTNVFQLRDEPQPGDEDLLDSAAVHTFLNGGTVYAVEPVEVPDEAPLAAVFRY
jgi:hypothetical protein